MTNHLFQKIRDRIAAQETSVFLETPDGQVRWTYADVLSISARYAAALIELGVEPGDRVAVQVEKSAQALMLYLGTIRAGAIFLPLNTAYTLTELSYFLGDAEPKIIVCDPAKQGAIEEIAIAAGVQSVETLGANGAGSLTARTEGNASDFMDVGRAPDDLAAILYTSGTTGRSKGAMLTHDNLASNAEVLVDFWRFTASDVLLHALPIYHTHGLFVAVNTILLSGGKLIFMPRFDADEMLRHMPKATSMMGVPTFYTRLLQHADLSVRTAGHMRLFISGSAPLLAETHREWQTRTGHAILERYGMTETNMTSSNPYEGERIAGTVGPPLPGIEVRITDPDSAAILPPEKPGLIEVRGPNVFKGYWRNKEK